MLLEGSMAPEFVLKDGEGKEVRLSDYRGKKVIIYFYSKDNTPGCTKQACSFKEEYDSFKSKNVIIIGISKDSVKSHQNFTEKYGLPFLLLSDPQLEAITAYDVWKEKKLYGKVGMGVVRTSYLIDENGKIEKVFEKVKPDKNAKEIMEYLEKNG